MKIVHRIGLNASDEQIRVLEDLGVRYQRCAGLSLVIIVIDEGHPAWPQMAPLMAEWEISDLALPEFTKKELAAARYLRMGPDWHHGYPQPEDDFKYRSVTYDDVDYCAECGIGLKQQAPFRMLREPKWGTKQILQLNWVMDEFFATPEAWDLVFRTLGLDCLPVLHHKTGRPLKSVVQLQVSARTTSKVFADGQRYVVKHCPVCQRDKLAQRSPGRFPHVILPHGVHMARTAEYFGGGYDAFNNIIVSAELYKAITTHKLKGACFYVVAEPGQALR
jgi:hypothetical protein